MEESTINTSQNSNININIKSPSPDSAIENSKEELNESELDLYLKENVIKPNVSI